MTIIDQPALFEVQSPGGALRGQRVVSHHDDRFLEPPIELFQKIKDFAGRGAVEVSGRLIGNEQVGVGDDGTSNRNSLLLAAGELARIVVFPAGQADDAAWPS